MDRKKNKNKFSTRTQRNGSRVVNNRVTISDIVMEIGNAYPSAPPDAIKTIIIAFLDVVMAHLEQSDSINLRTYMTLGVDVSYDKLIYDHEEKKRVPQDLAYPVMRINKDRKAVIKDSVLRLLDDAGISEELRELHANKRAITKHYVEKANGR